MPDGTPCERERGSEEGRMKEGGRRRSRKELVLKSKLNHHIRPMGEEQIVLCLKTNFAFVR